MARIEAPDCSMTNTKATLPPNFAANKSAPALTFPRLGGQLSFLSGFLSLQNTAHIGHLMLCLVDLTDLFFVFSETICVTHFYIVLDVSLLCRVLCALIRVSVANIVSRHRGAQSTIFNATQKVKYLNCCSERSWYKICIILH